MELQKILENLGGNTENINSAINELKSQVDEREISQYIDQYDGQHAILNKPDKTVGKGDNKRTVETAKINVTFQKKIVQSAMFFLLGEPPQLYLNTVENQENNQTFQEVRNLWGEVECDSRNLDIAEALFSESKVAELHYPYKDQDDVIRFGMKILSKRNGDDIYPHYDANGIMDAFTREYKVKNEQGEAESAMDIYTQKVILHGRLKGGQWQFEEKKNLYNMIPVVYYDQSQPEWADVQRAIDRYEKLVSNLGDTNDYYSSPMLLIDGELTNPPSKEEVGKVLQIKNIKNKEKSFGAKYLTWDKSPEAVETEERILKNVIYGITDTPDIAFHNLKGITNISGLGMKFMLFAPLLKSKMKSNYFRDRFQQRLTIFKKALMNIAPIRIGSPTDKEANRIMNNLDIGIEFKNPLPADIHELINTLNLATGGKPVMSQETAAKHNTFVDDPTEEVRKIDNEQQSGGTESIGGSFM